jgi:hypothetical protein
LEAQIKFVLGKEKFLIFTSYILPHDPFRGFQCSCKWAHHKADIFSHHILKTHMKCCGTVDDVCGKLYEKFKNGTDFHCPFVGCEDPNHKELARSKHHLKTSHFRQKNGNNYENNFDNIAIALNLLGIAPPNEQEEEMEGAAALPN